MDNVSGNHSDKNGIMFGIDEHNKSIVMIDPFNSYKHSNANMVILGMSGAGRSFKAGHISAP